MSTEVIGRTTRLAAINAMLRNIGERQVATLVNHTRGDVAAAVSELDAISKATQAEGWNFNHEACVEFSPQADGRIPVPVNALSITATGVAGSRDEIVDRGGHFWNKTDSTFTFTKDIEVEVITHLLFEELPEVARQYVMIRAARVLAQTRVGDPGIVRYSQGDEQLARYQLEARESESADYNVFQSPELRRLHNTWLR
jgi:hypothetical protein